MDLKKKIKVWNRSRAHLTYTVSDMRIKRSFTPMGTHGDMLLVPVEEVQALMYEPGGRTMLSDYLLIKDQEVCEFLGLTVEPEYYYETEQVKELLKNGTIEQLQDCLEFAPAGVIDLIKKYAVEDEIDSHVKRDIIGKALNLSIDSMIRNNRLSISENDGDETEVEVTSKRRAQPIATPKEEAKPVNKYNVVNRK